MLTQKVGKTRIPIEQCNKQMKQVTTKFDNRIQINQLGLADRIFWSSFLLQNFKLPFIQERFDDAPKMDRPCKAEICWYGAMDDGLVDVHPEIELWSLESDIRHWHELCWLECNITLTDTKISDLVLAEGWPAKLCKKHIQNIDSPSS